MPARILDSQSAPPQSLAIEENCVPRTLYRPTIATCYPNVGPGKGAQYPQGVSVNAPYMSNI